MREELGTESGPASSTPLLEASQSQNVLWMRWVAMLWAWSVLFHNGKTNDWIDYPADIMTTAAAMAVLFTRGRVTAFGFLLVAQLANFMVRLPNVSNHTVLAAIAAATMLVGIGWVAWERRGTTFDARRWIRLAIPAVRVEFLLLYFWVVFHKLNRDFVDPEWSAAVEHLENLSLTLNKLGLPGIPMIPLTEHSAIWGTLIVEAAIPLLLLLPATRLYGIGIGLAFHFVLGVEDFYDFTALMYAGLFLFLPIGMIDQVDASFQRLLRYGRRLWSFAPPVFWASFLLVVAFANLDGGVVNSFRVFKVLWFLWSIGFFAVLVPVLWAERRRTRPCRLGPLLRPAHAVLLVFPLLVVVNGACPYLGLKTRSVFAMFSNLRTENGTTNHFLVPPTTQLFGFQRDIVLILESSDPILQNLADERIAKPFFNLRSFVSRSAAAGGSGMVLKYQRGDQVFETLNAEEDPVLSQPYPYLTRKLLLFGGINDGPRQSNRH